MSRPVIGICAASEQARFGPWQVPAVLLPRSYAEAVQASGGLVAMLPPDPRLEAAADELLDRIDALIVAGGADVHPDTYGAAQHPETRYADPARDRFEVAIALRALERKLPLLGICRGMQVLNVALGGTLEQHLPEHVGHERHRRVPGEFSEHEVMLAPGSLAAQAAGAEMLSVKSHHHQGVANVAESLEVTGWSQGDQTIEALERADGGACLGVLWHPEEDRDDLVIPWLVTLAFEASG